MPRAGLDAEAVVAAAEAIADEGGLEQLTLAGIAQRLGVRSPSLYAHVRGLDDLRRRLALRGVRELTRQMRGAATGRAGADALHAVAGAYRGYAHEHPGAYAALQRAPVGDLEGPLASAAGELVEVLTAVLRGYSLTGDDALHGVRIVRAALHGFVSLERDGGFALPLAVDETFGRLVAGLDRALSSST
jgi:AcrR family transcriptional regulator